MKSNLHLLLVCGAQLYYLVPQKSVFINQVGPLCIGCIRSTILFYAPVLRLLFQELVFLGQVRDGVALQ